MVMDTKERYSNYVADKFAKKMADEQNKTSLRSVYQINKLARKAMELANFI